jgi:hypothetical protein
VQSKRQGVPLGDPARLPAWVEQGQFASMFQRQLERLRRDHGIVAALDRSALAEAERRWHSVRSRNPRLHSEIGAADADIVTRYIADDFGRLTREMLRMPHLLEIILSDSRDPVPPAAAAWPSGFCIYIPMTRLCLSALGVEDAERSALPAHVLDLRTWWSVRENVMDDSSLARPFLAALLGIDPVWHDWSLKVHERMSDATGQAA